MFKILVACEAKLILVNLAFFKIHWVNEHVDCYKLYLNIIRDIKY